jgi:tetratricopeptide (TPR) repeat protein
VCSSDLADALFREGNALLKESVFVSAAAKYREALARWDHPSIHYNLALALMTLDQPIETSQHLAAAVKYGPAPLQKERYEHARNYQRLLEQQLVPLTVRCQVAGARVELDGQLLFDPPGQHETLVRAGRHTLVASREGYVTNRLVRNMEGGQAAVVDLELKTLEQLTQEHRRWPGWIPWSVIGAGVAAVAVGGGFHYAGLQKVDKVDRDSRVRCPTGCTVEPADLAATRSDGLRQQKVAMGAYVAGGVLVGVGAALAALNRSERIVRPYEADAPGEPPRPSASFEVVPVLDRDALGLVALVRF